MTTIATEHVLARLENGAVKAFPVGHPALEADGIDILEDENGPLNGLDSHGQPLPTVFPHTADAELEDDVATAQGYGALGVAELKGEIDARNSAAAELQADAPQISKAGKKDDLVARLEADDIARAASGSSETPTPSGEAGAIIETPEV